MTGPWRSLPSRQINETNDYILRCSFDSQSYSIEISDLSSVWQEQLDRRSIIKKALLEDTSIDPSEDSGQLKILLEKLHASLQGEKDTTLTVNDALKPKEIQIVVTSQLPHPLQPLQWTFRLHQAAQGTLGQAVVLPLLQKLYIQQEQNAKLLDFIKEKDSVIGKLRDGLESARINLVNIFPRAAPQGNNLSRRPAAVFVRGLDPFDEQAWRDEWATPSQQNLSLPQVIEQAYGFSKQEFSPSMFEKLASSAPDSTSPESSQRSTQVEHRPYLQEPQTSGLQNPDHASFKPDPATIEQQTSSQDDDITEDEDSTFQVQKIPKSTITQIASEPSTLSSLKSASTAISEAPTTHEVLHPNRAKKLGTIGGSKPKTSNDARLKVHDNSLPTSITSADSKKQLSPPPAADAPSLTPTRPPPKKLGRIGGRNATSSTSITKAMTTLPELETVAATTTATKQPSVSSPTPPLPTSPRDSTRSTSAANVAPIEAPEEAQDAAGAGKSETAADKAARRREELKRELEAKRIAGARKKRKF